MIGQDIPKHGHFCPFWLAGLLDNPIRRLLHDPAQILSGLLTEGDTTLDLGCGPGYFSLGMARMVGEHGRVIAVDMQPEMLASLRAKAERQGLDSRIRPHQCSAEHIGLDQAGQADFALAFYMLHEVSNPVNFLGEVYALLKPGGRFLLAEPRGHVSAGAFENTVARVKSVGFLTVLEKKIRLSRAVLFRKPERE